MPHRKNIDKWEDAILPLRDISSLRKQLGREERVFSPEMQLRRELINILRRARKSAGLTQAEVARRMGIAQSNVARMESHGSQRMPTIMTVVRFLGACNKALTVLDREIVPEAGMLVSPSFARSAVPLTDLIEKQVREPILEKIRKDETEPQVG